MPNEKEIQKKYIQAQLLKQQINAMIEQKSAIDEKLGEMAVSLDAISKLEEIRKGEEIWSSVGGGVFVRSDIKDTESILVSVGAGVVAKKSRQRASEILKERMVELKKADLQIMEEVTSYAHQIEELEGEMESMMEEQEGKKSRKK
ncbi:MAG: prefoldin subunit alpha [Candidatus Aenigmarchaeota archaeon]|nr:prefoldin subunit alpha [Candidatus Aenigmarchaeota archaeon]